MYFWFVCLPILYMSLSVYVCMYVCMYVCIHTTLILAITLEIIKIKTSYLVSILFDWSPFYKQQCIKVHDLVILNFDFRFSLAVTLRPGAHERLCVRDAVATR